jgi:hypothetical protein
MKMFAAVFFVHPPHEQQHDECHRGTHQQCHPHPGLAEHHVLKGVGVQVHQAEHDEGRSRDHRAEANVTHGDLPAADQRSLARKVQIFDLLDRLRHLTDAASNDSGGDRFPLGPLDDERLLLALNELILVDRFGVDICQSAADLQHVPH